MKQLIAFALFGLLSAAGNAAPVAIDFEEFALTTSVGGLAGTSLQSNGFEITGSARSGYYAPTPVTIVIGDSGSKSLSGWAEGLVPDLDLYGSAVEFTLRRADDGAFALYDFDFFANNNGTADNYGGTAVIGYTVGGGTVNLSTALGTGGWLNLESVLFGSYGSGQSFTFSSATGQLDNIVVSAVPIPAAAWLFASALGLLGARRRYSRA